MSAIGKKIISTALESLEIIGELAAEAMGADAGRAKMIAGTIKVIVDTVRMGHARGITPEEVADQIEHAIDELQSSVKEQRHDIRAELDDLLPPAAETPKP